MSGAEVTVAVTPNGYADALSDDKRLFVMPLEETMTMGRFLGKQEGICWLTTRKMYYRMIFMTVSNIIG